MTAPKTSRPHATADAEPEATRKTKAPSPAQRSQPAGERGGPKGPEPTRYGDWEKGGRCFDF